MSDTRTTFSTVGAAAPDAVNDHPTLRFEHVTPERVVRVNARERFELHALAIDAGATRIAAELERWAVPSHLAEQSSAELVTLERLAVTSDFAARCNAELRRRADRLLAERRAARLILELGNAASTYPTQYRAAVRAGEVLVNMGARLELAPFDTEREHGPVAERVRVIARPELGFHELRGWLVGSRADLAGHAGALSIVKLPGQPVPLVVGTHETRLGWSS